MINSAGLQPLRSKDPRSTRVPSHTALGPNMKNLRHLNEGEKLIYAMSNMTVTDYMPYPVYLPSSGVPYTVKFDWDHLALVTPFDPDFTIPTGLVTKWLKQLDPDRILGITPEQLVSLESVACDL